LICLLHGTEQDSIYNIILEFTYKLLTVYSVHPCGELASDLIIYLLYGTTTNLSVEKHIRIKMHYLTGTIYLIFRFLVEFPRIVMIH
jgi:hypothetical protein